MARNIVNENEILDRVTIMGEDWNLQRLYFETTLSALQWCARRRLIKNSVECPTCQIAKFFIKRNDRGDGYTGWSRYNLPKKFWVIRRI
jgi:hypothetical protein